MSPTTKSIPTWERETLTSAKVETLLTRIAETKVEGTPAEQLVARLAAYSELSKDVWAVAQEAATERNRRAWGLLRRWVEGEYSKKPKGMPEVISPADLYEGWNCSRHLITMIRNSAPPRAEWMNIPAKDVDTVLRESIELHRQGTEFLESRSKVNEPRDDIIRELARPGVDREAWTYADIGRATGMPPARIAQIVQFK